MNVVYALLALGLGIAAGLAAIVTEEVRWEARNRLPRCVTCGQLHPRHAAHR